MRATVTVVGTAPVARVDASIVADAESPVGSVLELLAKLTGLAVADLRVDGALIDPFVPLAGSGLRNGSVVTPARPDSPPKAAGFLELRVLGGPAAGLVVTLPPGTTTLGRGSGGGGVGGLVSLADPAVSRRHLELVVSADGVTVADCESANGTTLDGERVGRAPATFAPGMQVRLGDSTLGLGLAGEPAVSLAVDGSAGLVYNRAPRLDAPDPTRPLPRVRFPEPAWEPTPHRLPIIATVVPLLSGVLLAAVMRRPEYLLFTVLSPVMMLGQWWSDHRGNGRAARASKTAHAAATADAVADFERLLGRDRAARRRQSPDPTEILVIARTPTARLWERHRGDDDFLQLSLGTGSDVARLVIEGQAPHPPVVHDVPICVRLRDVGVLGLAGEGGRIRAVSRALVGQLVTLHSPRDVRIVLLTPSRHVDSWEWMRWLPHLRPAAADSCQSSIGVDAETVAARISEVATMVAARRHDVTGAEHGFRAVVVLIDGTRAVRHVPGLSRVLTDGPAVGVYAICLDDEEQSLPEECGAVATTAGDCSTRLQLRVRSDTRPAIGDILADGVGVGWSEQVARSLAPLVHAKATVDDSSDDTLPDTVRLLDLLGVDPADAADLGSELATRWRSEPAEGCSSTRVPIGRVASGPMFVDIATDGPHALVAGTTGAGKSELLQTLVAALAWANRPDQLTFVLIDYKGGAAFGSCAALPHTVGTVTDLDGALVERALVSLGAELKRREALLAAAGATGIDTYRAAGGQLARLVIVVDEFAALADELPEFVTGLIGVAQRGRSLGVHLVLATQRPEGVVSADIRANTNLRICLSVMRDSESRDVIDSVASARISRATPGRGYARTGHHELRSFQTARVGGAVEAGRETRQARVDASPFRSLAHPASPDPPNPTAVERSTTDLDVIVAGCCSAASQLGISKVSSPWLDPLPEVVVSGAQPGVRPCALTATIALQDVPSKQARQPLDFDLTVHGHLLVAGSQRSGRSTVLRTLAGTLADHTPVRDLQVYGFDCGGGALAAIDVLPHCGGVVSALEPDRADRLATLLTTELSTRQAAMSAAGFASIAEQRAGSTHPLPHLVVAIDGWESFLTSFEDLAAGSIVEAAYRLIREGQAAGMHLAISADRAGLVGRLASMIDNRLVLRLADQGDFSLVGLPLRSVPAKLPAGRGFWVDGLVESQACLLSADPSGLGQIAALGDIAERSRGRDDHADGFRPRRVDPIPTRISWSEIAGSDAGRRAHGSAVVTLGVGGAELRAITADLLETGPGFVVSGAPRSGRSTTLATIAANLKATGWRIAAITPRPSALRAFADETFDPDDPRVEVALAESSGAGAGGPLAVLVDDAELVVGSAAAVILDGFIRRARDTGDLLILAGTTEDLAIGFRGFVVEARRSRSGLLLAPRGPLDGELLGIRLPRVSGGPPPAGRGFAVCRGVATALQVALPA